MTTNDIDAKALLIDQPYFALDAKGFAAFEDMLDNSPAPTDSLRAPSRPRRLGARRVQPWATRAAARSE